jgi:hypothetical protein
MTSHHRSSLLLVFDFDHSLIDDDSDQFLVKHLLPALVHRQVVSQLSAYEATPPVAVAAALDAMNEEFPLDTVLGHGNDINHHGTNGDKEAEQEAEQEEEQRGESSGVTTRTPSPPATAVSPTTTTTTTFTAQPNDHHAILAQMPRPIPTQWTDRMNWLFDLVHRLTPATNTATQLPLKLRHLMRDIPFSSAFHDLSQRLVKIP